MRDDYPYDVNDGDDHHQDPETTLRKSPHDEFRRIWVFRPAFDSANEGETKCPNQEKFDDREVVHEAHVVSFSLR